MNTTSILSNILHKMPYRSWLYRQYIDFSQSGLEYAHFPQGFRMLLDFDTMNSSLKKTFYYYKTHQYHEQNTAKLFWETIKEGDIVVDIGANLGYFTLMAGRKVGRGGGVVAFEPEPNNFKYLAANVALNNLLYWVNVRNEAISDKKGRIDLFVCPYDSGHHTIKQDKGIKDYKETKKDIIKIEVPTNSLDNLAKLNKPIQVIKIDAEGAEALILKGMKKIIKRNKDLKMFVEFFPFLIKRMGNDPEKFIDDLLKDFKVSIIGEDYDAPFNMVEITSSRDMIKLVKEEKTHFNLYCVRK